MYMSLTVLISQPNIYDHKVFMPLVFLTLKTYVDNKSDIKPVTWLDPLFRNTNAEKMLEKINCKSVDVLGLSCYDWNWDLNLEIAAKIKAENPKCLVVAGGPHPDWNDSEIFKKYPQLDCIVYQEGEKPFADIIKCLQNGQSIENVKSLILPNKKTPPNDRLLEHNFELSPWLANREWILDFKRRYIDNSNNKQFTVLWETDRGCPFKCTFCDWGSLTNNKVIRYPIERIKEEIDFFCEELKPTVLYHVGANLGIFPRDLEFIEYLCKKKPIEIRSFQYSTSKNTPERTVKIAKALYNAKLLKKHVVSLQHTDQNVLDCVDRDNIPVKRQIPMIQELNNEKMPCISQMIMGMPGDTLDLWIKALTDTIEWGIHYECRIYDFQLLPNSPAAQKKYMKKWDIETRIRNHFIVGYEKFNEQDIHNRPTSSEFIVKTKTYSLDDWLEMKIFGKMFMACHGGSITKWTSMFCRNTLGVSYYDFYKDFYENFFKKTDLYKIGVTHFTNFLKDNNSTDELQIEILNNGRYYQLEEYYLWNILYTPNFSINEEFWNNFLNYVITKYNDTRLHDLINFNKQMLLTLDYDPTLGKSIFVNYDWIDYIDRCTWNSVDNTVKDFDITKTLLDPPFKFNKTKVWNTHDAKIGQFPMGPNQDILWNNTVNNKETFVDCILAPTYMRGTRTVFNRGAYE